MVHSDELQCALQRLSVHNIRPLCSVSSKVSVLMTCMHRHPKMQHLRIADSNLHDIASDIVMLVHTQSPEAEFLNFLHYFWCCQITAYWIFSSVMARNRASHMSWQTSPKACTQHTYLSRLSVILLKGKYSMFVWFWLPLSMSIEARLDVSANSLSILATFQMRRIFIERGVILRKITIFNVFKWIWRSPAATTTAFDLSIRSVDRTHCFWCYLH